MRRKILLSCSILGLLLGSCGIFLSLSLFRSQEVPKEVLQEMEKEESRIAVEESLIEEFLAQETPGESSVESQKKVEKSKENRYNEDGGYWFNGQFFYTPDYATGYLDCVLEIPSVGIKRGVYKGNEETLKHNLDVWMICAAKESYKLGETGYVIYGHNHPSQNVSFNRLMDVSLGDEVFLTGTDTKLCYKVSAKETMERAEAVSTYTEGDLDQGTLIIMTCARNSDGSNAGTYFVVKCQKY